MWVFTEFRFREFFLILVIPHLHYAYEFNLNSKYLVQIIKIKQKTVKTSQHIKVSMWSLKITHGLTISALY